MLLKTYDKETLGHSFGCLNRLFNVGVQESNHIPRDEVMGCIVIENWVYSPLLDHVHMVLDRGQEVTSRPSQ